MLHDMQTHFGREAQLLEFNSRELELIIGSLLGDATLLRTPAGYCFRVNHGLRQQSLVDWKYRELRRFVRTGPRRCGNAYYFRTVTHSKLTELRRRFYDGKKKVVPVNLLREKLSAFGLAVWIMDDGALDGGQLRLNTQGFSIDEAFALVVVLQQKFGLTMTVNYDKGLPRLRCSSQSMNRLIALVSEHMREDMLYKLPAGT